ncbi:hypothetical protein PIB30_071460 [Stylosanthes scabra]|uniref:PB1-like domain-containing protein n=1 Tax=Stylosanthes scabra TaxID=79078 RepID=A0ABU6QNR5_9FABA|nr:hypothetical protein [Stylosanthes scabra]
MTKWKQAFTPSPITHRLSPSKCALRRDVRRSIGFRLVSLSLSSKLSNASSPSLRVSFVDDDNRTILFVVEMATTTLITLVMHHRGKLKRGLNRKLDYVQWEISKIEGINVDTLNGDIISGLLKAIGVEVFIEHPISEPVVAKVNEVHDGGSHATANLTPSRRVKIRARRSTTPKTNEPRIALLMGEESQIS